MAIDPTRNNDLVIGVIKAGHDAKPDPNQLGLAKVALKHYHGNNVKEEHLGYSQMLMPANQGGATEFNGVPDPGQQVLCLKSGPPGASDLIILGCFPTQKQQGGQAGNIDLGTAIDMLRMIPEINVAIPPQIREVVRDGARIREILEKGINHNHNLLMGIPSHGAMYALAGIPQKQLTNIATATQAFGNILTGSMMAQLPGSVFSMGNLLNSLTSSVLDELLSSMPQELAVGVQSMFTLMQSIETIESGGFNTMGKVDPTTYLANAVNLLKGNQSLGEVVSNLSRLQVDTSLFGLDKLGTAAFDIPSAFGVSRMVLSPLGELTNETPEVVQKAMEAFGALMTSGVGFPSGSLTNMFGDSAAVMSSLFDRLPPDKQTNAKNMMEGVVASGTDPRTQLNNLTNLIHTGQNILSIFK